MKLSPQQAHIGRQLVEASEQLARAKRFENLPGKLAAGISADMQMTARRRIADLIDWSAKYPAIAKDEDHSGDWSTLEFVGVSRAQLPVILKALGASEFEIKQALVDPAGAMRLLAQFAKQRSPK
jgi:hypothetical protein